MWIFGYGSLIWKADFPFEKRQRAFIRGYVRRFWQGSEDHRGTPEEPGRVVTLIPYEKYRKEMRDEVCYAVVEVFLYSQLQFHPTTIDWVWGMAYYIALEDRENVLQHLNYREKNGYSLDQVECFDQDNQLISDQALLYIAMPDNVVFKGPEPVLDTAKHILHCRGPSGFNLEYALELWLVLRQWNVVDDYLEALVGLLRREMTRGEFDHWVEMHAKYFATTIN